MGILSNVYSAFISPNILIKAIYGLSLVIPILFLYYGTKTYFYLEKSPKTLKTFVLVVTIIYTIICLLSTMWGGVVITPLIGWYLIHNIKRLSMDNQQQEQRSKDGMNVPKNKKGLAIASFVLSFLSIIPFVGIISAIIGLIFGLIGLNSSKRGLAIAGIVICIILLFIQAGGLVFAALSNYHNTTNNPYFFCRNSCSNQGLSDDQFSYCFNICVRSKGGFFGEFGE